MPDQMPPPGPERDAEILLRLGATRPAFTDPPEVTIDRRPDGTCTVSGVPPYSTDPAACDRLVAEMVRREYQLVHRADKRGHGARFMIDDPLASDGLAFFEGRGESTAAAISAAALLALRGGA